LLGVVRYPFSPELEGPKRDTNVTKRDVAAGIAILQEAGGLITTANPPEDPLTAEIEDVKIGSRLYLAIR
jgi:fructose-1,6-bisphosphatase/inositol monophosphatase family enzyme